MTGWRLGLQSETKNSSKGLGRSNPTWTQASLMQSGIAGIAALRSSQAGVEETNKIYERERADASSKGSKLMGIEVKSPKATFYVWAPVPKGFTSISFAKLLLEDAGIVATPGVGFGEAGEGYIRFALAKPVEKIKEAVERG